LQYCHLGFPRLVDAEDPHRRGFGEQPLCVLDERAVRGRPGHIMCGGDLGHRAGGVADRCADLGAQPAGGASTARDLSDGLGERSALAVLFPASPSGLVPPQQDSTFPVRNVLRCRVTRALMEVENTPHEGQAAAASSSVVISTIRVPSSILDTRVTCTPGSPNSTVVLSITPLVLPTSECFATSRLQEAKGIQLVDALNALRFRVARSRSKSRHARVLIFPHNRRCR